METIKCRRCGQCCHLIKKVDGKPVQTNIRCPYLRYIGKIAFCRVYKDRLKQRLPFGTKCCMRKDSCFDYEECPYNNGKKQVVKVNC